MKEISFRIVVNDGDAKRAMRDLSKELGRVSGVGKDFSIKVKPADVQRIKKMWDDLGTGSKVINDGIERAVVNLNSMKTLMGDIKGLSGGIARDMRGVGTTGATVGTGKAGGGTNFGSRTGTQDPNSGRALLSTFSGFIRGGQNLPSQIGAFSSGIGRIGLGTGLGLGLGALGVRQLIQATGQVIEFGKRNAELAAILGKTRDGTAELTEQQLKLGAAMSFTSSEIAGAQISLAKLGFTQGEILDATEGVARFAIVAGAAIPEAAAAAGAALQSFDLEASEMDRVVSVLGVSTAKSALDFEKLKIGIGTTFATAKTFGLEIEDVTALLGELSNKGLSASVAATATRNILLNLANDSGKLRKTLAGIGINEVKGLDGVVNALQALRATGIDLAQTFELTDKRSVNAFNTFLRGAGDITALRDSLIGVNDQFKIMEKERLNSLSGSLILFQSAVERVNLTLAQGVGAESLAQIPVDFLTDFLNSVSDFVAKRPGDAVKDEFDSIEGLIGALSNANIGYSTRNRLIAQLKINYPDLIKGIDLESASSSKLLILLTKIREEYEKKYDIAKGEGEFERALARENELLDRQAKLVVEINKGRNSKGLTVFGAQSGIELSQNESELRSQQSSIIFLIKDQFSATGDVDPNQLAYLESIIPARQRGKKRILDETQSRAELLVTEINDIIRGVQNKYDRQFVAEDFKGIKKEGGGGFTQSAVDRYIVFLERERDKAGSNIIGKTIGEVIAKLKKEQEKYESGLKIIGKKGDGTKDKYTPQEGSLDFLELQLKEAEELIKRTTDATTENYNKLIQKASEAKKALEDRKKEIELLRPLDDKSLRESQLSDVRAKKENLEIIARDSIKDAEQLNLYLRKIELESQADTLKLKGQAFLKDNEKILASEDKLFAAKKEIAQKGLDEINRAISKNDLERLRLLEEIKIDTLRKVGEKYLDVANEIAEREIENETDKNNQILLNQLNFEKALLTIKSQRTVGLTREETAQLKELDKRIQNVTAEQGLGQFQVDAATSFGDKVYGSLAQKLLLGGGTKKDWEEYYKVANQAKFEQDLKLAEQELQVLKNKKGVEQKEIISKEQEILDLRLSNEERIFQEKKKKEEEIINIIKQGAEAVGQVLGQIIEFQRQELQNKLDAELQSIDTIYSARIKNAAGNQAEIERLEQEYESKKTAAEKRGAEERKKIAKKEAQIQLALGVIKAIPNLFLMGLAAVTGAIQLAIIDRQKFDKGGFTGRSLFSPDETGQRPAGIVHENEYVAPTRQIRKYPALFRFLDSDRKKFAEGGFTSVFPTGGGQIDLYKFAEIIANRTAQAVYEGSYSGSMAGSKEGSREGIVKVDREVRSRSNSLTLNTY